MSQTTEIQIQNQNGLSFRTKLNQMLSSLNTAFSGTTAPTTTEADMLWMDTSTTPNILKRRNSSDTDWEVVPLVEGATNAAPAKTTPVDADLLPLVDSASSNVLKKLTWANAKATLKTYFDTFYLKPSGGNLTGPLNYTFGADMASASTVDLSLATGNSVRITGTTTINSFGTAAQNGTLRIIRFTGVLTITHLSGGGVAGDISLPGLANVSTQISDTAIFVKNAAGVWIAASYVRADGTSLAGGLANQRMSLTGTVNTAGLVVDITGIPNWAKRVTIQLNGVSSSGVSNPRFQLGTSGGIETTGYIGGSTYSTGVTAFSSGIDINPAFSGAANAFYGTVVLTNLTGNQWTIGGSAAINGYGAMVFAGSKTLTGILDRIRVTTVNGTDTLDAGSVSLLIEGY